MTKLCPSLKLYLVLMRIPVHSRVKKPRFFQSLDRILIASLQMYAVKENRLEVQRSRKQIYCAWDDDFEIENELAKSTNSPKIYDFNTLQKKSKITEMVFDVTSDRPDKPFSD